MNVEMTISLATIFLRKLLAQSMIIESQMADRRKEHLTFEFPMISKVGNNALTD